MTIVLHRANSVKELTLAAVHGWGIEVDVRTHEGKPYLAHDPIVDVSQVLALREALQWCQTTRQTLVLDFKETGIAQKSVSHDSLTALGISELVKCTDLLVPDQLALRKLGVPNLTRVSKYEQIDVSNADMLPYIPEQEFWLDYVFAPEELQEYAQIAGQTYLVSPELHTSVKPDTAFVRAVWETGFAGVCTDFPEAYASETG
ncbi:MAG: hypothetical protein JSS66_07540 [Armatimonadetes bacterium]|nr:hypothetical protein [Armatimonadota bacterium]